jgi:hypothetical protein
LVVEKLDTESPVMKLVAHKVALRAVLWEHQSVNQDDHDAFDGNVFRDFDCHSLVSRNVPDFKVQHFNQYPPGENLVNRVKMSSPW